MRAQQAFRLHYFFFDNQTRAPVPDRKAIVNWINNLETMGRTTTTTTRGGCARPVRTTEGVKAVRVRRLEEDPKDQNDGRHFPEI